MRSANRSLQRRDPPSSPPLVDWAVVHGTSPLAAWSKVEKVPGDSGTARTTVRQTVSSLLPVSLPHPHRAQSDDDRRLPSYQDEDSPSTLVRHAGPAIVQLWGAVRRFS